MRCSTTRLRSLRRASPISRSPRLALPPAPAPSASYEAPGSKTFSYDELKGGIPTGVDPAKKEQYLSDADFEKIMKSPRGEFNEIWKQTQVKAWNEKAWKQAQVKKAAGLY